MSKVIMTSNGLPTIVDDADFDKLSKNTWYAHKDNKSGKFYVQRAAKKSEKGSVVIMSRVVLGNPIGGHIDHANRDALDNRRENLRLCSASENNMNKDLQRNNSTGYRGVRAYRGKYRARLGVNGKVIHIGTYLSAEDAASAYDEFAKKTFGDFARTNEMAGRLTRPGPDTAAAQG